MSVSRIDSCLRMPNISSCLRMVLAFSTSSSSAKETSSAGVLALRSWSFISRMRVSPVGMAGGDGSKGNGWFGARRGGDRRSWERLQAIWPDAAAGPTTRTGTRLHLPAFGEIARRYEKKVRCARVCCEEASPRPSFSERLDHRQDHDSGH